MNLLAALFILLADTLSVPPTVTAPGTTAPAVVNIQGNASGVPVPVTGSLSVSGAGNTVGSTQTFNANSVCATVWLAGQPGAAFQLNAGTSTAVYTPSFSADAAQSGNNCTAGTWTPTSFIDATTGNTSSNLTTSNPNAESLLNIRVGTAVCARVCTGSSGTTGSATGFMLATVASATLAPSADVTDRAGRLLGKVYGSDGNQVATANTGRLQVDVITGGGSNGSVVTDGAAPASSDTQIGGSVTTSAPSYTTGQVKPFSLQTDGSLRVAVTAGGGSNASVSTTGAAVPGSATYSGMNVAGNLTGLTGTANGLKVDGSAVTQPVSGTVTANVGTTNGLALDATVSALQVAQASTTSGQKGGLAQGAVTTGAPSYTTAQTSPLSLTTAGALRTDSSATTQPVSGTVTANQGGTWTVQPGNTANTTAWKVDGSAVTQPVSGTVTTTPPANASTNVTQFGGTNVSTGTGVSGAGIPRVTISSDSSLAANQSVNVAQLAGSTTATLAAGEQKVGVEGLAASGAAKSGNPVQVGGVFNTTQPTVTTGQAVEAQTTARGELMIAKGVSGFSIDNTGFNVNNSPTVNQGGAPWSENITQIAGTTILTGNGATGAGSPRVTIANDQTAFGVNLAQYTPSTGRLPVLADQNGAPWSENITQIAGTTVLTGAGVTGAGSIRVTNATSDGSVLATANSGRLQVDVVTGGGSNASVGTDYATAPTSATVTGWTAPNGTMVPAKSTADGSLYVALAPNAPINLVNIGTKNYSLLTAPTIKTMTVDPSGRPVTVLGPQRAPVGFENAQVVAVSPVPAPICPLTAALSQTASTTVIAGVPGKLTYVCKVFVVSATAQSVSLTEGTGTTCGTLPTALAGSTTVANGMALAANGGWVEGTGAGIVYAAKKLGDDLCVLQSGAGNVAGSISYVQF